MTTHGRSDVVDYEIFGDDLQFVEVELDPGETVIGEAGSMMFMDDGVTAEARLCDGSEGHVSFARKIGRVGKRALAGESVFLTHFTNVSGTKARVGFAAPYPGKIIPIDMGRMGGELISQRDSFLCAARGVRVDVALQKRISAGMFAGEGFVLQKILGYGMAFLHAGGSIKAVFLRDQKIRIETGALVAMQPSLNYRIERSGNVRSMLFAGEGLFLTTLEGTGWAWLQSMPFDRLVNRIMDNVIGYRSDGKGLGDYG